MNCNDALRLVVADDHLLVRECVTELLTGAGFEVIAKASDGVEAVRLCRELKPDIALLDITMPLLNGIDATRQITEQLPECKVILLTMHTTQSYVLASSNAGACGYVLKTQAFSKLLEAIDIVLKGGMCFCPKAASIVE
jgi:DNA-binding NarL/FixJ family response regulator